MYVTLTQDERNYYMLEIAMIMPASLNGQTFRGQLYLPLCFHCSVSLANRWNSCDHHYHQLLCSISTDHKNDRQTVKEGQINRITSNDKHYEAINKWHPWSSKEGQEQVNGEDREWE